MSNRQSHDWPRLSGRPQPPASQQEHASNTVFRRFFELIERLERPRAAPVSKTSGAPAKGRR
ncbi:MAG: hypothetical protein ACRCS0_04285 [Albidovulum sp.]